MKVHKPPLSELFSNRKRYVVPLFQRPYVWTRDRQWEPLWQDIVDRADAVVRVVPPAQVQDHFLGAIVTAPRSAYGVGVPIAEVVDGQQRLTTLQIVLHAFRDVCLELEESGVAEAVDTLLRNQKPWASEEDQFKVWPTNLDQEVFGKVIVSGSRDAVLSAFPEQRLKWKRKPEPRPRLAEAYLCFNKWIRSHLATDTSQAANALYSAIVSHLQIVHIELEPGEDPQAIFEALNGRGEPLTPADLIKNHLFRQVVGDQEAAYRAHWRDLDEAPAEDKIGPETRFWRRQQRQGRLRRSRLDLFLFHYLTMRTGSEVLIGNLFRDFQGWHTRSGEDVMVTLADIRKHAGLFAELLVPSGSSRLSTFATRARALDTSTVYPVVLYLLGEGAPKVAEGSLPAIFEAIESYLVRRAVCRLSTKAYNHDFLLLLKEVRAAAEVDAALVRAFLLGLEGEHHNWPDDEAFRASWLEKPAYQLLGPSRTGMILKALNDAQFSRFHEDVEVHSALTVEHVLPQTWRPRWPWPVIEGLDHDAAGRRRDELLHTFGNLTLITGKLNSKVKNAAFGDRRPELAQKSLLKLNVWFQEVEQWDEGEIRRRGKALFEVARRVWPGPS
ncbi:DUF262 domain-containing HNH endonuclease family protein [Myxococcota bacterium]|nr:DUF262 domain-containing HNH endonuclease family protein [Myxococcota bacterium]